MEERFVQLNNGNVYKYTEVLAKRRDARVVDGFAAATYFRKQGVSNEITEKYPERSIDAGAIPDAPRKPPRDQSKRGRGRPKSKAAVVITEDEKPAADALEELLNGDGDQNVPTGD